MKIIGKIIKNIAIIVFIFLIFFIGLIFVIPPEQITQKTIISVLKERGFDKAEIKVSNLSTNQFIVRDFNLGDKENFAIAEVDVSYNLAKLLRGNVNNIIVSGLRLKLIEQNGRISAGNMDRVAAILKSGKSPDDEPRGKLPFEKMEVRDGIFSASISQGEFNVPVRISAIISLKNELLINLSSQNSEVNLTGVSLPDIGKIVMSGKFNLNADISVGKDKTKITSFKFTATTPGHIKFEDTQNVEAIISANPQAEWLVRALRDCRYDKFEAVFDTDDNGRINSNILIEGNAPYVYDGREVKLNINIKSAPVFIPASLNDMWEKYREMRVGDDK